MVLLKFVVAGVLAASMAGPDATSPDLGVASLAPAAPAAAGHPLSMPWCQQGCSVHRLMQLHP